MRDQLPAALYETLAVSLGIDALIILRDICGLPPDRIEQVMTWSARALFKAAMKDAGKAAS